jgi:serine/threonine protein phosphatase PrpC
MGAVYFAASHKAISSEMEAQNRAPAGYDTTLTAVIYNGRKVVFGHVGDGGIIGIGSFGNFVKLTEVQKGEERNVVVPI